MVFLWLCCEGWKLIGSYRHVSISNTVLVDDEENVIAFWDGECWKTPGIYCNFAWRRPFITATDEHPHPNQGKA